MLSKMTRLMAVLLLTLLSGCFVSSDKELITATTDPGFPKQPFSIQLDKGALIAGTNGLLSVERRGDHFVMQDALTVRLSDYATKTTASRRKIKFKKLPNARNLYIAQDVTSGNISYFLTKFERGGFWVSQMKLSVNDLATASKNGLTFVGEKSVSVKNYGQVVEYARYWNTLKGENWNPEQNGIFYYKIITNQSTASALLDDYADLACLAAAGHPEDPEVRKLSAPANRGVQLQNIKDKDVKTYCQHGFDADAKQSVKYALARGLFQIGKYTGTRENPGSLDIARELMGQKYPLAYVLLSDAYVQGRGVKKDFQKAKQILNSAPVNDPNIQYMKAMYSHYGTFGAKDDKLSLGYALQASNQGHGSATTWIGKIYANGWGVKPDDKKAFSYFSKAAAIGNAEGALETGKAHYFGKGVPRNYGKAFPYMKEAADQKNGEALYFLGFMYRYGQGVKENRKKAMSTFISAVSAGNQLSKYEYAEMYYDNLDKAPRDKKYHAWLVEGADKKRRTSQFILGKRYLLGKDVEKSIPKGLVLLDRASQQGLWKATNYLASLYETGTHVKKDLAEARKLYSKSALSGSLVGQRKMASLYEKGVGVPVNAKEAQKWYQMAAEKGDANSQLKLGTLLEDSAASEALAWYQKAHASGNSEASWRMGRLYDSGKLGSKDLKSAAKYYRASADRGNSEGKLRYGYVLASGLGVVQDKSGAKKYYEQAANAGYARAMYFLGLGQKNGFFGAKNNADAEKWLSRALSKGVSEAKVPLDQLRGQKSSSLQQYEERAAQGDVTAQYNAGYTYLLKLNNADKAETFFAKAAQSGNLWSQYYLGVIHGDQKAYPQHWAPQQALMWLYTAERTGLRDGKKVDVIVQKYQQIEQSASSSVRIKATESARECFSSNYQNCR